MSEQHYLAHLFEPRSIAVLGASERKDSLGYVLFKNIRASAYAGRLYPINPRHESIQGVVAYRSLAELDAQVDLAIIATRASYVPEIIEQCSQRGIGHVIIVSADFIEAAAADDERRALEIAHRAGIRVLGPNCLGILRPALGLNASFSRVTAEPGHLALVTQSGALCSAVLDWAKSNQVGFSSVISLGRTTEVDFGEVLDYLSYDHRTQAILLYIERIRDARRFMSALRSVARLKPILLLKAGRYAADAEPLADERTLASDAVFDAAIRRVGVVRVKTIGQLFYAAKALTTKFHPPGRRLAIMSNGRGPGAMAADRAVDLGIIVAELSTQTRQALDAILPTGIGRKNPIDLAGDATPERYQATLLALAEDDGVDGILVMLSPQALTEPLAVAQAIIKAHAQTNKPLLACWMGEDQVSQARSVLEAAGIPAFRMPETAVELYDHLSAYYQNQKLLLQTPAPAAHQSPQDAQGAQILVEGVLQERRQRLSELEAKAILQTFRIPVAPTELAHSRTEALRLAEQIGFPVVMKIDSPDLLRKSEVGGVRLKLANAVAVRSAYREIFATMQKKHPSARINGVSIEAYIARPNARKLMIHVVRDPVFGPVIRFGAGGVDVEIFADRALALPPLNRFLVQDLIRSVRIAQQLGPFHDRPAINRAALENVLLNISEMICELPCLQEIEINPLLVDEDGAIALDVRMLAGEVSAPGGAYSHMAIHPYPAHLLQTWRSADGHNITLRPIRPEDAAIEQDFVKNLSDESKYSRFMNTLQELSQSMLIRFTQIDYDREMALIATTADDSSQTIQIGVARYLSQPDGESVEFALVVADHWQKHGIGRKLMGALIECARQKGYRRIMGDILAVNTNMLRLMSQLGFSIQAHPEDQSLKQVVLPLHAPPPD